MHLTKLRLGSIRVASTSRVRDMHHSESGLAVQMPLQITLLLVQKRGLLALPCCGWIR